jgi:hypothetical protein
LHHGERKVVNGVEGWVAARMLIQAKFLKMEGPRRRGGVKAFAIG